MRIAILFCCALFLAALCPAPASAAQRSGYVDVGDGVRIHYLDGGVDDAGSAIVFVPGWSTSGAIWAGQFSSFERRGRVVAIDPRSQGQSTIVPRGNTPEQRARDLHAVIDALGLKRIVLVGWSQGVQDVAAYAAQFGGERIAGYVLVDAPVGAGAADSVSRPEQLRQFLDRLALYQSDQRAYLRGMFKAIISQPAARARIDEYVATGMRTPPDIGISMLMMDFVAVDRRGSLAKFDRPTLVIASAQSPELDAQRAMARSIPGARIETVDNAAHAVFLDQPERFRALLGAFVERLDSVDGAHGADGSAMSVHRLPDMGHARPGARDGELANPEAGINATDA